MTADPHKVSERPESGKPDGPLHRWARVLAMRGLTYREKVVLLAIAQRDGQGGAWHTYDGLADLLDIKRGRVGEAIAALEAKGALSHRRTKTYNVYAVHYDYTVPEIPDAAENSQRREKPIYTVPEKPAHTVPEIPDANRTNKTERDRGGREAQATRPAAPVTHPERVLTREGAGASSDGLAACASPTAAAPSQIGETAPGTDEEDARQHADLVRAARMDVLAELPPDDWSDQ